jgi:two-component system chemotaxis response regulator CheB
MTEVRRIRVVVIDDSAYNRQTISQILGTHPEIEVVGKASDGEEGLKLVAELKPDLVTLDLEMPKMDGFTFLRILMTRLPTPVIVISSNNRKQSVFQALELGAIDFIAKPTRHISPELENIRAELTEKVLLFRHIRLVGAGERVLSRSKEPAIPKEVPVAPIPRDFKVVCIGSSTGGPPALQLVLAAFPDTFPAAVLISQHMPPKFTKAFAERLDRNCRVRVKEAEQGDPIVPGQVLVAPGGKNLAVSTQRDGSYVAHLVERLDDDKYVPSIDRMFASAAETFGDRVLGVVLTGMGMDGKAGAERIKLRGGQVFAESQETAVIYGMPKEVIQSGSADRVLPLGLIGEAIVDTVSKKLAARAGGR